MRVALDQQGLLLQVAAVITGIDPGQHDFAVAGIDQAFQSALDVLRRHRAARPAHFRDDAVGAGESAALLDLQEGARALAEVQRPRKLSDVVAATIDRTVCGSSIESELVEDLHVAVGLLQHRVDQHGFL